MVNSESIESLVLENSADTFSNNGRSQVTNMELLGDIGGAEIDSHGEWLLLLLNLEIT